MFSVLPILIIDGISLGIYSSEITHLIPSSVPKDLLDKYAGYSMISLGTGSTIGGYLCGKFADKFGTIISGRIGIALFLLGCGLFITAVHF
jgi:MFS family permease